jgi:uncharacterized protein YciI
MPVHLCKLLPPRPTFPADMSENEARLMQEHAGYWTVLVECGTGIVFGPVFDPAGVWGLAVVDVTDEAAAAALTNDEPVIRAGCGFHYEIHPMPRAVVQTLTDRGRPLRAQ